MPSSFTKGSNIPLPVSVANGGTGVVISTGIGANVLTQTDVKASTFTFSGTGGGTTASANMRMERVGDYVYLFIPTATAGSGTASNRMISNTAIDSIYRPLTAAARASALGIWDAGGGQTLPGSFLIGTNGIITMFRDGAGSNFTNSSTCGIPDLVVLTYYVGTGS